MPAYVTAYEIKQDQPDALDTDVWTYDVVLKRNAEQASRLIERLAGRSFFAQRKQYYIEPEKAQADLWLPEPLLDIISVYMTTDYGDTLETVTATDYLIYGGDNLLLDERPYHMLRMSGAGDYGYWYTGEKAVQLLGITGYHDDYDNAWEDSEVTIADNPLTSTATILTVADADIEDVFSVPIFQVGQVLRIEDEQVEVTRINAVDDEITIKRAMNGTTAAAHVLGSTIEIYHAMDLVRRCASIQSMRWFKRGQQSYQDASASPDQVQMLYVRRLDPDIATILSNAGLTQVRV